MRNTLSGSAHSAKPLVGIAAESVTTFGRSVLRGVVRYANLRRKWELHEDLWRVTGTSIPWPQCDGTVIAGIPPDLVPHVIARSRYAVTCSGGYDPRDIPVVGLDEDATAMMAAEHLIDRGFRNFAFYGPSWATAYSHDDRPIRGPARRARAFHQALAKRGFSCFNSDSPDPTYEAYLTHAHHDKVISWLLSLPKPIGILAVDDMMAHDLAQACRSADIGVPDHVAIIGVNNDDLLCESAWPPLSSVEVDFARMGYLAAKMLDRLMSGETLTPEERLVELPPIRVYQRMSTDVLAVDQPNVANAIRFIREHACDPCTVSDVMKAVPVARRTLEMAFVERLGRSLHDEIVRVRIETARRLLLLPDLTIPDVARRCGISTVQSFNRSFLQVVGSTPAAFRRQSAHGSRPLMPKNGTSSE